MPTRPLAPDAILIARFGKAARMSSTANEFCKRTGLSRVYGARVMTRLRAIGIAEPSVKAPHNPGGRPKRPVVTTAPPTPTAETEAPPEPSPPVVDVGPDGTAHAWSVDTRIRTPEELVAAADLDLETWEIQEGRVNSWPTAMKDADGEPRVVRLWQVSIRLRPRAIPIVPVVEWLPPPPFALAPPPPSVVRRAVVLPDMQIGGRWDHTVHPPMYRPHHDRAAIDLTLQVVARERPEAVVLCGDNLDLAPLGRWPITDAQRQTTRLALGEYRWILHRLREVAGDARIVYCAGNHEARWETYLEQHVGELLTITPTLPDLLGLDSLGIEWVPYRAEAWLWDRIRLIHGEVVRSGGGSTASALLKGEQHSVVYGHVHRAEVAHRRVTSASGPRQLFALSPGCLCRLDGDVPGSSPRLDWQQGVGLIEAVDGMDDAASVVRIDRGRALHRGEVLVGRDTTDEWESSLLRRTRAA